MDRGDWQAIDHGVAESDMTEQLSTVMSEGGCPSRCLIHVSIDIYMFFFRFSSHIHYYGVLGGFLVLCSGSLWTIL